MYECKHCGQTYKRESAFLKHSCEAGIRAQVMDTPKGARAFLLYSHWLKSQKRFSKAITPAIFSTSQFYKGFISFVDYIDRMSLYEPLLFVELMCELQLSPSVWQHADVLDVYNNWIDKYHDPLEHVATTVKLIISFMDIFETNNASTAIANIHPRELIEFIRNKQLSPYLFLCSTVFKQVLSNLDYHDRTELTKLMDVDHITGYLSNNPTFKAHVLDIVKELEI